MASPYTHPLPLCCERIASPFCRPNGPDFKLLWVVRRGNYLCHFLSMQKQSVPRLAKLIHVTAADVEVRIPVGQPTTPVSARHVGLREISAAFPHVSAQLRGLCRETWRIFGPSPENSAGVSGRNYQFPCVRLRRPVRTPRQTGSMFLQGPSIALIRARLRGSAVVASAHCLWAGRDSSRRAHCTPATTLRRHMACAEVRTRAGPHRPARDCSLM